MAPDEQPKTTGTCFLCEVNSTTDDEFCHGCQQPICNECATNENMPFGGHEPEDHSEETDWEEDE